MRLVRIGALGFTAMMCMALQSCSRTLDLSGKRCPCVKGYVCDLATGICIIPEQVDASTDGPEEQRLSVISVALGHSHTCVLLSNGGVKCWGANTKGELGYANTNQIGDDPNEVPVNYNALDIGGEVTALTAGSQHTCALLVDGRVRCWGRGDSGQLGYQSADSIGDNEAPREAGDVDVGGIVVQISAGGEHTCALLDDGAVRCWGEGSQGQLGYGNGNSVGISETPSAAGNVPLGAKAKHISAGAYHTCAVLEDGNVKCWGRGTFGALGYGNDADVGLTNRPQDVGVLAVGGTVSAISTGEHTTCTILSEASQARCWGYNLLGQLGYGHKENIGDTESPDSVPPLSLAGEVVQIATAQSHACAITNDKTLRCWGNNDHGQLGYGHVATLGDDPTELPSSFGAVSVGGEVAAVALGSRHTCALLGDGHARCWGDNFYGQLGYGDTQDIGDNELASDLPPVQVVP